MNIPGRGSQRGALSALGLAGEIALSIAGPIVGGVILGDHLDRRFGGGGLILAGVVVLSVVLGFYCFYRVISRRVP